MQGHFSDISDLGGIKSENIPIQVSTIILTKEKYLRWSVVISLGIIADHGRVLYKWEEAALVRRLGAMTIAGHGRVSYINRKKQL